VERKVLLSGVTVLERLVARVRDRVALRLWRRLAALPIPEQRTHMDALVQVPDGVRQTPLDRLRRAPTRVSGPALVQALQRVEDLHALGVSDLFLDRAPPGRLNALAGYAAAARVQAIARMPDDRRLATLLAFAQAFEIIALDDGLDLFDLLMSDLLREASTKGQKTRVRTIHDLDAAALQLREACQLLLDERIDDAAVRRVVFARIPRACLVAASSRVAPLARPSDDQYYPELVERYRSVRAFLPALLHTVPFQGTQAGRAVLEALHFLSDSLKQHRPDMRQAPLEALPGAWRRVVLDGHTQVDRRAYMVCVAARLQESLKRRDVFVRKSGRWGDPRVKLLRGAQWEAMRPQVCRALGHPDTAEPALQALTPQLDAAYRRTAANFLTNTAVRVEQRRGRDTLTLTGPDKLDEPPSLITLCDQVQLRLPRVDLPEGLLEIHARTGFAHGLTHISDGEARVTELPVSLCAVLLAEACNIGLEPVMHSAVPALTRGRLSWVQQNYIRAETLIRANARLVDAQTTIPLAQVWGGGEVASADGMRFAVPVRTVNSGPNRTYYGAHRGITYYNFTSDQFTGFHAIIIPGTLRDSMFILDGLLEQQTSLRPVEVMADTAGTSDMAFRLCWLRGYQFSPRLADIGEARFWRLDSTADYGLLNGMARHRINTTLIARNWDDLLRVAGSLHQGTVNASELLRSLLRSRRPSALARAIGELGRIPKTLYMLACIDDESYRRRILVQLNRGEGATAWRGPFFMGNVGSCGSGIAKVRRINSGRLGWWSR
jgi:TnpA family transposase